MDPDFKEKWHVQEEMQEGGAQKSLRPQKRMQFNRSPETQKVKGGVNHACSMEFLASEPSTANSLLCHGDSDT